MRTTKKLVVLCLVLVMGIVTVMPSTFSWYDHNGELKGNSMQYTRSNLPVSSGSVTMTTKKYVMDGNEVYYDTKGNKEYDGEAIDGEITVDAGKTQYFGTTFTNKGESSAFVNQYLKNVTNLSNVFIGTTAPSLTEKGFSSTVHLANNNKIRVYFQWDKANNWNDSGAKVYVVCNTPSGKGIHQFDTVNNELKNKDELKNVTTYYIDLDKDTTSFYFATDGNKSGFNDSTGSVSMAWYRTKLITDVQAGKGYYLTGIADDTTFNAAYTSFDIKGGLSTMKYFDTATLNENQKAYVKLDKGTHYTGASASYSASGDYISVDSNSGLITTAEGFKNGTITTTITSSLGDTTTVTTAVSNPDTLDSVAVATNIEIPKQKEIIDANENKIIKDGTALVVWYVVNKSSSPCTFEDIFYTK